MKKGDLVKVTIPKQMPGALTAIKFYQRLAKGTTGKVGIIVNDYDSPDGQTTGSHVLVQFASITKVIHRKYLEVVSEH